MKNNNQSDYTINFTRKALNYLHKHADLKKPEEVKHFIATLETSNGYKRNLCIAYNKYCKFYNIQWEMPLYKTEQKLRRIPTKEKLEMLIAKARKPMSIKLTISKETGLRPVELCRLEVKDIDLDKRLIYPKTAKHGNPRKLKISISLKEMLNEHIHKYKLDTSDKLFKGNSQAYGKHYRMLRNRLAEQLHDPSLKTIRLYDFRHYFATNLYAKTRDILHVKQQLGHRKIETTLIYTQLLNLNDDEWTCKTAINVKDATALIENGFEYVTTTPNALMLFRKRK